MHWISLESQSLLDELMNKGSDENIFFFKHSTRCSISSTAKSRLENFEFQNDFPIYYVDVLEHRNLSNKLSEISEVMHQSPQILVFNTGKCIYSESQLAIYPEDLEEYI